MDQHFWDRHYTPEADSDRIWSGDPNAALVDEVANLRPGRALDVGCGEGDDARWLAGQGWTVTGVDISQVALDRATSLGSDDSITWLCSDLVIDGSPTGPFELVSMQYFTLAHSDTATMRALIDAVAPGGTMLMVAHDYASADHHGHDPDWCGPTPDELFQPGDVAETLRAIDDWAIDTLQTRPRKHSGLGAGGHHLNDVVLRAHRI